MTEAAFVAACGAGDLESVRAAHGSHNHRSADDDYRAIVKALIEAGSNREASFNKWGEPPEALGSPRVGALLKEWR